MIDLGLKIQFADGEKIIICAIYCEANTIFTSEPGLGVLKPASEYIENARINLLGDIYVLKITSLISSYDHWVDMTDEEICIRGKIISKLCLIREEDIPINPGIIISKKLMNMINEYKIYCTKKEICGEVMLKIRSRENAMYGQSNVIVERNIDKKDPNCFDIRKGEISYYAGIQPINDSGKWDMKGRQTMKASRFINMFREYIRGDIELHDRFIELLSSSLVAIDSAEILISDDPGSIYKIPTSPIQAGTLGDSCMNAESGRDGAKYVDFYTSIGVKILYILSPNKYLMARALVWEGCINEKNGQRFNFVDRIYGSESNIQAIIDWADDNGYYHKEAQSYSNDTLIKGSKKITKYTFDTGIMKNKVKGIPYTDTMKYYVNTLLSSNSGYCLQNQDGNE